MNLYQNDLFHDGGERGPAGDRTASPSSRPESAQRIAQAKTGLAARRQDRMQAQAIEKNQTVSRALNSPSSHAPENRSRLAQASTDTNTPVQDFHEQQGDNVYGLRGSYDPNEGGAGTPNRRLAPRQQSASSRPGPHRDSPVQIMPPALRLDLSDLSAFLQQPGPRVGPVQCYIVRDKGSAKMYPKYSLFLEDGKRFLLAARKRKKQTTRSVGQFIEGCLHPHS